MRTKIHLATVFLAGLCVGSVSYTLVRNAYQNNNNNNKIIAEQNSQENLERYRRLLEEKKADRYIYSYRQRLQPELHVISINRGFQINEDKYNKGRAAVKVDRPGQKVVLLLNSRSPVIWQVNATEGTEITKVILGGNRGQNIRGINNDIPVEKAYDSTAYARRYLRVPQSIYANNFPVFVRQVYQNTGLEISSFQSANTSKIDRPFQVDSLEKERVFSVNFPRVAHPCGLKEITFKGLYRVDNSISFGDYSLTKGPDLNNFIPTNVSQITYNPYNNKYYGIQNYRSVVEIDPKTKATRSIVTLNNNRKSSYLNGITFDTKRNRLLVYNRANRRSLYAYSFNNRTWQEVNLNGNLNGVSITSMVYHPEDDSIYAVKANSNLNRDRNYLTLYKLNSNGAVIDIINFSDSSLAGLPYSYNGYGIQLMSSGKNLILVWGAKFSNVNNYNVSSIEPRIYAIDPDTKKVKLTWKDTKSSERIDR